MMRLREFGMFSLQKKNLGDTQSSIHLLPEGVYGEDVVRVFSKLHSERVRGNRHDL